MTSSTPSASAAPDEGWSEPEPTRDQGEIFRQNVPDAQAIEDALSARFPTFGGLYFEGEGAVAVVSFTELTADLLGTVRQVGEAHGLGATRIRLETVERSKVSLLATQD